MLAHVSDLLCAGDCAVLAVQGEEIRVEDDEWLQLLFGRDLIRCDLEGHALHQHIHDLSVGAVGKKLRRLCAVDLRLWVWPVLAEQPHVARPAPQVPLVPASGRIEGVRAECPGLRAGLRRAAGGVPLPHVLEPLLDTLQSPGLDDVSDAVRPPTVGRSLWANELWQRRCREHLCLVSEGGVGGDLLRHDRQGDAHAL